MAAEVIRSEERDGRTYLLIECDGVQQRAIIRPARGINAEPAGYKVALVSQAYPTAGIAERVALAAIEALPDGKATVF